MSYSLIGRTDDEEKKPVYIDQEYRREGLYIIGKSGSGKTTLIENLIFQDIKQGLGLTVIDPHGDLIDHVISHMASFAQSAPSLEAKLRNQYLSSDERKRVEKQIKQASRMRQRLENDVILLDLEDRTYVPGFDLFYCENPQDAFEAKNTVDAFKHLLESFIQVTPLTPQMNQYFHNIAYTLVYNHGATLIDIRRLLTDEAFRKKLIANVNDPDVVWFWDEFYEGYQRGQERARAISAVVNKLDEFLDPAMRPWFGQARRTINISQIIEEQKILLVKLKAQWKNSTMILGNMLITQLLDAAYARRSISSNKRTQYNVYADEYQWFSSHDFATLFTEARKYALGITIAHQVIEQQPSVEIKATTKQADSIIVLTVPDSTAKELAGSFDCSPIPGPVRYEPLKTPVLNPIEFMLAHGVHPGDATRYFIQKYGRTLVEGAKNEENERQDFRRSLKHYQDDVYSNPYFGRMAEPSPPSSPFYGPLLITLNDLFHKAMVDGKRTSVPTQPISQKLVFSCLLLFEVSPDAREYVSLAKQYPTYHETLQKGQLLLPERTEKKKYHFLNPRYLLQKEVEKEYGVKINEFYGAHIPSYMEQQKIKEATEVYLQRLRDAKKTEEIMERMQNLKDAFDKYMFTTEYELYHIMSELAWAPVEADSGLQQEVPGPEIPTPEVEARIANQLKTQNRYHARTRLFDKEQGAYAEYNVKLEPAPRGVDDTTLARVIGELKRRNHEQGYLRLRSEVIEEISQRQQMPFTPQKKQEPPDEPKPPIPPENRIL